MTVATADSWLKTTVLETAEGLEFDYANPRPSQVSLGDIAHGLSMTCRFGGHTSRFYSVAEHSVIVSQIVEGWGEGLNEQLGGLFHDGHEAYLGDVPTPMKRLLGESYRKLVGPANYAIAAALDLDVMSFDCEPVREADHASLFLEAAELLPVGPDADPPPVPPDIEVRCLPAELAKLKFEARALVLLERREAARV